MNLSTYNKKVDLLKDIDWAKVTKTFDALKHQMESMSYQAPENINENYRELIVRVSFLAKELLLFDRTATYRKALEDILKLQGEYAAVVDEARTIAKAALESMPPEKLPNFAQKDVDNCIARLKKWPKWVPRRRAKTWRHLAANYAVSRNRAALVDALEGLTVPVTTYVRLQPPLRAEIIIAIQTKLAPRSV